MYVWLASRWYRVPLAMLSAHHKGCVCVAGWSLVSSTSGYAFSTPYEMCMCGCLVVGITYLWLCFQLLTYDVYVWMAVVGIEYLWLCFQLLTYDVYVWLAGRWYRVPLAMLSAHHKGCVCVAGWSLVSSTSGYSSAHHKGCVSVAG